MSNARPGERVTERTGLMAGRPFIGMPQDGSCLFHSFSHWLNRPAEDLRSQAANFVYANWNEPTDSGIPYGELTENSLGYPYRQNVYLQEMRDKQSTYGGPAEVYALSALYKLNVEILSVQHNTIQLSIKNNPNLPPFTLRYSGNAGAGHYEPYASLMKHTLSIPLPNPPQQPKQKTPLTPPDAHNITPPTSPTKTPQKTPKSPGKHNASYCPLTPPSSKRDRTSSPVEDMQTSSDTDMTDSSDELIYEQSDDDSLENSFSPLPQCNNPDNSQELTLRIQQPFSPLSQQNSQNINLTSTGVFSPQQTMTDTDDSQTFELNIDTPFSPNQQTLDTDDTLNVLGQGPFKGSHYITTAQTPLSFYKSVGRFIDKDGLQLKQDLIHFMNTNWGVCAKLYKQKMNKTLQQTEHILHVQKPTSFPTRMEIFSMAQMANINICLIMEPLQNTLLHEAKNSNDPDQIHIRTEMINGNYFYTPIVQLYDGGLTNVSTTTFI